MRYLVVIDQQSFAGKSLIAQGADGISEGNPVIDCKSCEIDHHYFLKVVRGPLGADGKHQSLYIPYHAVLVINEYGQGSERSFGFAAG